MKTVEMPITLTNVYNVTMQYDVIGVDEVMDTVSAIAGHEAWSYENRYTYLRKETVLKEKVPEFDNAILMTNLSSDLFQRRIESYIS